MRRLRPLALVLPVLLGTGFVASPAPAAPAPAPVAAQAAPRVMRMASMLAYDTGWLSDSKRLAFIGNRQEGQPAHVYVWEPATAKLFQVTSRTAKRHSLVVSKDDRYSMVQGLSSAASAAGAPKRPLPASPARARAPRTSARFKIAYITPAIWLSCCVLAILRGRPKPVKRQFAPVGGKGV